MIQVGQDVHAPGVQRRAGIIGLPARHSLSPVLHRAAWQSLGLQGWAYGIQDVHPTQLADVVGRLDETWAGLSVTMPHKQAIIPLMDLIDGPAKVIGAVNTVLVQHGGLLVGANTDAPGILAAINETRAGAGFGPVGQAWPERVVILGARATASSAAFALGGQGVRSITVLARRIAGPGSILVAAHAMGIDLDHIALDSPAAAQRVAGADLVISTLPARVPDAFAGALAQELDGGSLREGATMLDAVYDPWPTKLAAAWQSGGGLVAPGWSMLLHQGAEQVRMMTARQPDVAAMRQALVDELARRSGAVPDSPLMFPGLQPPPDE